MQSDDTDATDVTDDTTSRRFTLRLPVDVHHRCEIDAVVHRRSLNAHIADLLDAAVPAYEELTSATAAP